ncbi:hypothetical protein AB0I81_40095 [Nonomuraea sp. NPDC050404]
MRHQRRRGFVRRLLDRLAELLDDLMHWDEVEPPCDAADWGFDQPNTRRP